ncbi:hypothetical protein N0V82_006492 [Gnomoniopsis sp. IMI 355080]|nr:hypothetical protein N0V82_006492 [Gnomoniopsis sp. IMI 355080]
MSYTRNSVEANERARPTHNLAIKGIDPDHGEPRPDENHGGNEITRFKGPGHNDMPRRPSSSLILERHHMDDPEQHKSRWIEHKGLGARNTSLSGYSSSSSTSSCPAGCICACHSVKDWGRWILHFPFLGTLMVTHRGVLTTKQRTPCSNPRCPRNSASSYPLGTGQEKLVRMDIYPSMWLLRATISVFLSFGVPSPELLIRVNKVFEITDVHSSMNQLLWAIQREEPEGVKHFLQSRLVRADDIYGEPSNGFTPLRLALDRKSGEIASLLYSSGGFHGTLPPSAASSLLLWLEQDPSAVDFLTQHFPLSTILEEANYNPLHQIILGLRHDDVPGPRLGRPGRQLDLAAHLRTASINNNNNTTKMVNQPNAFGRTPLHVAALRGDADAVLALLDAGAARDARGNHGKHALHYACKAGSIEVVDALVARGASLQVRDVLHRTPLFDLVGYVSHLLTLGIVQEPEDWAKATLLALNCKRTAALERLLPYGPPAGHGELPLYPAIHIGFQDGVRLLLAYGADCNRTIDAFGEGILHWLAGSGLAMLRLFKGLGVIRGVDVERRDHRGKTAMEIMEGRWDLTEEFRREFWELLEGVRKEEEEEDGGSGQAVEAEDKKKEAADEDMSEDEFYDALDNPNIPIAVPEGEEDKLPSTARGPPSEPECFDSDRGTISIGHEKDTMYDEQRSERGEPAETGEAFRDRGAGQKYLLKPRDAKLEGEKVFTDEAGLKFLGTSDAMLDQ